MKKPIYKRWWFWTLIALFVVIGAASLGNDNNPPVTEKDNATNPATTENTDIQPENTTPAVKKADQNQKIEFKNIIVKSTMGMSNVYGEVINNDNKAHSFTIKISFYDSSNKLLGSAAGAVNDLNGGTTKTFSAVATEDYSKAAGYKAQVDTLVTSTANKKEVITFSNLVSRTDFGTTIIEGEAKNIDDREHSFTVVVSFYDTNNKLIGVASGAVNDLPAGQTKTFTALSTEDLSGAAGKKVQVDTLVE